MDGRHSWYEVSVFIRDGASNGAIQNLLEELEHLLPGNHRIVVLISDLNELLSVQVRSRLRPVNLPQSGIDKRYCLVDLYLLVAVSVIKAEDGLDCLLDLLFSKAHDG